MLVGQCVRDRRCYPLGDDRVLLVGALGCPATLVGARGVGEHPVTNPEARSRRPDSHDLPGDVRAQHRGMDQPAVIRGPARTAPWRSVEDVELATLGWVHWHNTTRLHGYLRDVPPTEYEAASCAGAGSDQSEVDIPTPELQQSQGDSPLTEPLAGATPRPPVC